VDPAYRQHFIRAGALACQARAYGASLIVPGASYNAVIAKILEKIDALGGRPAFPPQLALNHVAAHYLPQPDEDIRLTDQLVKLDIGVSYRGAIGDCAITVDLSGKHQILIDAAEAALLAAERRIEVGLPVREIGALIERTLASYDVSPIRNLSGHGLGRYKIHTSPIIPNCADHSRAIIQPGMTFAIEPFATNGRGRVVESGAPAIFSQIRFFSSRSTPLLAAIHDYHGLPFSLHDLLHTGLSLLDIKRQLASLIKTGFLAAYAPLVEESQGMVAQAENSLLVDADGRVLITTRQLP
jgi:methionyl aminopeptidase